MVKLFFSCLFCLVFHGVFSQEKSIYGKVLDPIDQHGIANINIINKRSGQIVATNASGDYYIRAMVGDSILISTFGYNRKGFVFDGQNKNPVLNVKQQAIMLHEVVVTDRKLSDLHKDIKDFMDNPYNSKTIRNEILKSMINSHVSSPGMGVGISIDALYDMFSKEGKSKRKLADLQYNDIKKFYLDQRFNSQVIAQITHLPSEELEEFKQFCRPSDDFILRSTDYELTFKILRCLTEFNRSRIYRKLR